MYNQYHPNPSGYNKMAGQWFTTLETILPQSEIPEITSTGITEATKGEPYVYTVTATGPPSPTFELTDNPAPGEMTINEVSGLIEWTPDAVDDVEVTVKAENWTGSDTQTFTISVNARPRAVGDAYTGILEGDTLTVSASQGVLNNDTDENDSLSAVLVSDVSYGTLNLSADGSLTYTHDDSENFNDSFTYVATDGKAQSEAATVTLTITPVDDPVDDDPVDDDPVTDPASSSSGGGGGGGCFITTLF
jgi:VCBS repeat-containing protein